MDDVVAAISDPIRRDILMLLRGKTMSAGEIVDHFEISRPGVSRHLRVLRESGLVADEVRGRQRLYRLELAALKPLEAWLAELRDVWNAHLDALETEVYRTRRERRADQARTKTSATAKKRSGQPEASMKRSAPSKEKSA